MSITIDGWGWQEYRKRTYTGEPLTKDCIQFNKWQNFLWQIWIWFAGRISPCNECIREYVLRDLKSGKPDNAKRIYRQLMLLSINGTGVFLESYEYWSVDTLSFLDVWLDKYLYGNENIAILKSKINENFSRTAYADGRPCPIGDQPDKVYPELKIIPFTGTFGNIYKEEDGDDTIYEITAHPTGFNCHCPAKNRVIKVESAIDAWDVIHYAISENGDWYNWYDCSDGKGDSGKYPGRFDKLRDMLQWCRIWSAFKLLIGVKL